MTLHVDHFTCGWPVPGEPIVPADADFEKMAPSPIGLAMEAAHPGSYYPHYTVYYYETAPHEDGECEQHRPAAKAVRSGEMLSADEVVLGSQP